MNFTAPLLIAGALSGGHPTDKQRNKQETMKNTSSSFRSSHGSYERTDYKNKLKELKKKEIKKEKET